MDLPIGPVLQAMLAFAAAGVTVLALLHLTPRTAPTARRLWAVLLPTLAYLLIASGLFWLGGPVLKVAVLACASRVAWEVAVVAFGREAKPALPIGIAVGTGAICAASFAVAIELAVGLLLTALAVAAACRAGANEGAGARFLDLLLFPLLPLAIFAAGAAQPRSAAAFLLLLLLVETFDSYALLGGKLLGRRKAFPYLSPGKTVEGLLAGGAALAVTAAIGGQAFFAASIAAALGAAALAGCFAVAGDLAASRIKRKAQVKDYPAIARSQGGLLDMTDGWLFAGAAATVLWVLMGWR